MKRPILGIVAAVITLSALPLEVFAHGERAQEPFLRMRTIQWYDVEWSKETVAVNETVIVSGKFRVAPDWSWPQATAKPDVAFLNISSPGPVFVRKGSFINGVNMANSTGFEMGRDYEFEVHLKARHPGRWHVHSMLNVKDAGPIVGPGDWIEVTGDHADFVNNVKTLTGETINLDTYSLTNNLVVHGIWAVLAVVWLLYWLVKPLFFKRNRMLMEGREDELITKMDKTVAVVMLVLALGGTFIGYQIAESKWPITLPLQSARAAVEPLPMLDENVAVKLERATYRVPGRAMKMALRVTNNSDTPVRLGEFNTATVRFLNPEVGIMDAAAKKYPDYLLAESGLTVDNGSWIQSGESRLINIVAQDAAFETERLSTLIFDPDSRFGGLLFFYDAQGRRHITNVGGVIVPIFM